MIPIVSLEIIEERQRDRREQARRERASKAHVDGGAEAPRFGVRHAVAGTLRRVADTLEPIT
ncbi:MAG: hypothetical protein GEU68_06730 [Actinobacteria bacterium]|nr:hypothetical protein [Actinomycetota bacterium]